MLIYILGAIGERKKQLATNVQRHIELRRGLKPQRLCILKGGWWLNASIWLFRAYQSDRGIALLHAVSLIDSFAKDVCRYNIARVLPYLGRVRSTDR